MPFKNILVEKSEMLGTITVNRPAVRNALDLVTLGEIEAAMKEMAGNAALRVVIITGSGEKAFVSGADIAAMKEMNSGEACAFATAGHHCMRAMEECGKPVIAAVNGFALGGGMELALACDFIIASERAMFGLPEVKLGLYPGFGGTQRLSKLVGLARARELIFTGRMIDAREAMTIGLVCKMVSNDALLDEVHSVAREIAANGPFALAFAKRLINHGRGLSFGKALEEERGGFELLFKTKDRIEGLGAFLEKRKPKFTGE